jgi:excisionase family DNA binding protein
VEPRSKRGKGDTQLDQLLLTKPDAAHRLAIGVTKLDQHINAGDIRVVRIGRAVRVPATALDEFVATLEKAGAA